MRENRLISIDHLFGARKMTSKKLSVWLRELRAPFFVATIVPYLMGAGLAIHSFSMFDPLLFLMGLALVVLVHAGSNVMNDYFDYLSGTDRINRNKSQFNGGSPFLISGALTPQEVRYGGMIMYMIAGLISLYLSLLVGWMLLLLFLLGTGIGYLYTHHQVNLAGKGLGEVAVWFAFGPLTVMTSYYVQTGIIGLEAVLVGLPIGLMISNIILVNEFPDREADHASGKNHWVVRLGEARAARLYSIVTALAYLTLTVPVILGAVSAWYLLSMVTLPLAWRASSMLLRHHSVRERLLNVQSATIQIMLVTGLLLAASLAWPFLS